MNKSKRTSWWPSNTDSATQAYINAHYEFDPSLIKSGRPYPKTPWNRLFRSIPQSAAWRLRQDHIANSLTADLIASVEILQIPLERVDSPGMPGGIGAEGVTLSLPVLDGGVFVDFTQYEHEYTNAVHARQVTLVIGPMTLRYLLAFLGIESPRGRLKGEACIPTDSDILNLLEQQRVPGSPESATLRANGRVNRSTAQELTSRL